MALRGPAREWEKYGRVDPYYGVLSDERFRRGAMTAADREEFFRSGDQHVAEVLDEIRARLDPTFQPRRVLDFGCGVGRLLVPFAARTELAVGVDVSAAMLEHARRNCDERGASNVELVTVEELAEVAPGFDLVHSFIVFQHVPVREGHRLLARLVALLRPGGVGALHFSYRAANARGKADFAITRAVPPLGRARNALRGRGWSYPQMHMYEYDLGELVHRLGGSGAAGMYVKLLPAGDAVTDYHSATLFFATAGSA